MTTNAKLAASGGSVGLSTLMAEWGERGERAADEIRRFAEHPHSQKTFRLFSITQAAELVGVSDWKIRQMLGDGTLTAEPAEGARPGKTLLSLATVHRAQEALGVRPRCVGGARAIAVVNQKGGAGKTVTALHLAQYAAIRGFRTLLIDSDPQATSTMMFGFTPDFRQGAADMATLGEALVDDPGKIKQNVVRGTHIDGLHLIPADIELQAVDMLLPGQVNREGPSVSLRLRTCLEYLRSHYDLIVIDAPPSVALLGINAMMAAEYLLVPVPPGQFEISSSTAFFGLLGMLLSKSQQGVGPSQCRILITKHDGHTTSNQLEAMIRTIFRGSAHGHAGVMNHVMRMTDTISKGGTDLKTVYEIDRAAGSRATYLRALTLLDEVNREIIGWMFPEITVVAGAG